MLTGAHQPRVVCGQRDVEQALAEGACWLLSPPGWGPAWWMALTGALPSHIRPIYDAGTAPGVALAALRAGCRWVQIDAPTTIIAKLTAIAAQYGATLVLK